MSNILKLLPFLLVIILIIAYLISGNEITVDTIVSLISDNYMISIPVIMLMFALKSISVIFPLAILYLSVGVLFNPLTAIIVNTAGISIAITIPYLLGYFSGSALTDRLKQKYPKFDMVIKRQRENHFFTSYILRMLGFLPGDAVSMYLGSIKIPFSKYFPASLLGMMPGVILASLIGGSMTDPTSPMFIVSISIQVVLTVISLIIYYHYRKNGTENVEK